VARLVLQIARRGVTSVRAPFGHTVLGPRSGVPCAYALAGSTVTTKTDSMMGFGPLSGPLDRERARPSGDVYLDGD